MLGPQQDEPIAGSVGEGAAGLPEGYLDLYKLAVEMADRISARRGIANTFFLTVNTAVTGVLGTHSTRWYLAAAGIVLSLTWWVLLSSYRDLNRAKFEVILDMEKRLPVRVFGDEWDRLDRGQSHSGSSTGWLRRYRELGRAERVVPWVFVVIYIVEIVRQIAG